MRSRMSRVVNAAAACRQIGLVGVESLANGRRAAVITDLAGLPARELFGEVLRLIEVQYGLAVAGVEVVSLRECFGPVRAVTVADLDDPRTIRFVAPVEQSHATPQRRTGVRLAANC